MKLRALGNLSGPDLDVESGVEFDASAELARELIERKVAEPVEAKPAAKRQPAGGE
jgi:hypothetical protein